MQNIEWVLKYVVVQAEHRKSPCHEMWIMYVILMYKG